MVDLEIVLKNLKNNKSRDPYGLMLMNIIKDQQIYPRCLEACNIWKLKGPRSQFSSYRGIFRVSIFRAIFDGLIYNNEYNTIDSNLIDS